MSCSKIWKYIASISTENTNNVPAGKGDRSIVWHIGCAETGLLENCLLLFRVSKSNKSSDRHTEMNWYVFSSWCESIVFPKIKQTSAKSVVVLYRATYHKFSDEEDRRPTNGTNLNYQMRLYVGIRYQITSLWHGETKNLNKIYFASKESLP